MSKDRPTSSSASPLDGVVAGLGAGLVSSTPGLMYAVVSRRGIWEPVRLISTTVGLAPGRSFAPLPVAVGGLIHVGLSVAYGALYARITPTPVNRPLVRGVSYGLLLHVVNIHVVTRAGRFRKLRTETSEPVELLAHALYGAALASALSRYPRRTATPPPDRIGAASSARSSPLSFCCSRSASTAAAPTPLATPEPGDLGIVQWFDPAARFDPVGIALGPR